MVYQFRDGEWHKTQWRTLSRVKNWATRQKHTYRMQSGALIVSTAAGDIYRYAQK